MAQNFDYPELLVKVSHFEFEESLSKGLGVDNMPQTGAWADIAST
jgi:hypothetical protein